MPIIVDDSKFREVWYGPIKIKEVYEGPDLVWKSGPNVATYNVSTGMVGVETSLVSLNPPVGETWTVRVNGTVTTNLSFVSAQVRVGSSYSTAQKGTVQVDHTGTVTSSSKTVSVVPLSGQSASFTGTVTVTMGSGTVRPVETITLSTTENANTQYHNLMATYGLNWETATDVPFDIRFAGTGTAAWMFANSASLKKAPMLYETERITATRYMFSGCTSLTEYPPLNTSNVTNMDSMFRQCPSITQIHPMDTSKVTNMRYTFADTVGLTTIPDLQTSAVDDFTGMFYASSNLADGSVRLIGKKSTAKTGTMISNTKMTRLPFYDANGKPI